MTESNDGRSKVDKVLKAGETAQRAWELGAWILSAGSAVIAFVNKVGGLKQFLVEVGFLGVAAYMAMFVVVTPVMLALEGLDKSTQRETKPSVQVAIAAAAAVGGAALVRFVLFAEDVTQDLDGIATAFGVTLGVAILLVPIALWWYYRASTPAR